MTVLARSYRALAATVEQKISDLGLCVSDFMVLEVLLHKGPLTISAIQSKVLLASGSMTAAVDRLERMGLVIRHATPGDRRARTIELTENGKTVTARAYEKHAADLEDVMSALDGNERERLYHGLRKLGRSLGKEQQHDSDSKK